MKQFAWVAMAAVCLLAGCGDETIHHRHPPQDPPDYHGVPTDTRPPSTPEASSGTQPQ